MGINAWLGISGPHADEEEITVNERELGALKEALQELAGDDARVPLEQWEMLSRAIGELQVAIDALREGRTREVAA